jgi:hypothetical protein
MRAHVSATGKSQAACPTAPAPIPGAAMGVVEKLAGDISHKFA